MNAINIIMLTIAITLIVQYAVVKLLRYLRKQFNRLKNLEDAQKRADWLFTAQEENRKKIEKLIKQTDKLDDRLGVVEMLAENFDRDMDTYHANINKDNSEFNKAYNAKIKHTAKEIAEFRKRLDEHSSLIEGIELTLEEDNE